MVGFSAESSMGCSVVLRYSTVLRCSVLLGYFGVLGCSVVLGYSTVLGCSMIRIKKRISGNALGQSQMNKEMHSAKVLR